MAAETSRYDLAKLDTAKYWELVRRTLEDIFAKNQNDAQPLEHEVKNSSADEQILFYHSEPLTIAAGIAEKDPSPQEIKRYKALRAKIYGSAPKASRSATTPSSSLPVRIPKRA